MTKNITLAVDDEVLARDRLLAAERRASVNAMIRQHMGEGTGLADRRREARAWMATKARESMANDEDLAAARTRGETVVEERWRWSREATYAGRRFGNPEQE